MRSKTDFYRLFFEQLARRGFDVKRSQSSDYIADIYFKNQLVAYFSKADTVIQNPFVTVKDKLIRLINDTAQDTANKAGICRDCPYTDANEKLPNGSYKLAEYNGVTLACKEHHLFGYVFSTYRTAPDSGEMMARQIFYNNKENPVYRDLAMLLYDAAAGSDSFLWNGHTTLEANSRFICLDTHDLQNASDNVKRTQYLNLLSWCWEEMSRDRNERCLLVCDEAYLMIDPQVPQSLVFLRNVEKRARKYEAGLAIISHSVVDFLAPEVKMYGQALLDIPCYKILMGCDGKNLQETKDLYNLTDAEQELLESKRRGHALFIIGSKRLHVNFEIPAYKFSYMGKAGGR